MQIVIEAVRRCVRLALVVVFIWMSYWLIIRSYIFFEQAWPFIVLIHVLLSAGVSVLILFKPKNPERPHRWAPFLFGIAIVTTVPFAFMGSAFGERDFASFLISLQNNQLGELALLGFEGFMPQITIYLFYALASVASAYALVRFVRGGVLLVLSSAIALTATGPVSHHVVGQVSPNENHALIADRLERLAPIVIQRPEMQKNLILVYLESVERTYRDLSETSEAFAPLSKIEDEGLNFTQLHQVYGASMTIGGLIATQCGVPLLSNGIYNPRKKHPKVHNVLPQTPNFLPTLTCLGDVLSDDGYVTSYINGSSLEIYAKGDFLRAHGFSNARGFQDFSGWETEPRQNIWGMDDDLLFERVKTELRRLASQDKPFVLGTLTIATHGPEGYPDSSCSVDQFDLPIKNAIACTGKHVSSLLEEVGRLGLAETTIVAVMSDHLAMRNPLSGLLKAQGVERRNLVTLLGTGSSHSIARPGTMLDIYPTLLEAMGYQIANGSAGLGVSLLSANKTLTELADADTFSDALRYNSILKERLWRKPAQGDVATVECQSAEC